MERGERVALQSITREAAQECFSQYVAAREGGLAGAPGHVLSDELCDALAKNASETLLARVAAISTDPVLAREVVIGELFRFFLVMQNIAIDAQSKIMEEHTN